MLTPTMETMGDRIRRLREAKGWTQRELADRVGVTEAAVSQWERGETKNIKNLNFAALLEELGTTQEYLLFGPDGRARAGKQRKPRPAGGSDSTA